MKEEKEIYLTKEELIARGLDPDLGRLIEEAEPLDLKPIGWLQHAINRFFLFGVLWRIRIKNWMRR